LDQRKNNLYQKGGELPSKLEAEYQKVPAASQVGEYTTPYTFCHGNYLMKGIHCGFLHIHSAMEII
jgi:hypothetical protein